MAAPLRRTESQTVPKATRPALALAARRRRWPAAIVVLATVAVMGGLLGAAVFHTQLAERQLRIDKLEGSVDKERERFDELRYQRAELRSPVRLAAESARLGMVRGETGQFVEIDPWQFAAQLAAAGVVQDLGGQIIIDTDPLQQFSDVKRVSAGQH